jgi:hypothetical protein
MGYNSTATTLTLTAKLTPLGRQAVLTNSIGVINKFALGDSDANYNIQYPLTTGEIPSSSGDLGPSSGITNSTYSNVTLRSKLKYQTNSDNPYKSVSPNSYSLNVVNELLGLQTLSASSLTQNLVNRTDSTDKMGNLFFSFGLPISEVDKAYFSAITANNGGFSNTAISGINQDNILVIAITGSNYGEMIDGKSIKLSVTNSAATFELYGTYRSGLNSSTQLDAMYREVSTETAVIGNNIAFLFCDDINKPNGNASKSWATGWNTYKPFSVNGKELFNYTTTTTLSKTADTCCGIAYLDKGIIVITEPTIVNDFVSGTSETATTVNFDSVVTRISQDILCVIDHGEFARSNNSTWGTGDIPRVSEIGLYNSANDLLAVAKFDRQLEIPAASFAALTVKISL